MRKFGNKKDSHRPFQDNAADLGKSLIQDFTIPGDPPFAEKGASEDAELGARDMGWKHRKDLIGKPCGFADWGGL